jgi:hypothetical protein
MHRFPFPVMFDDLYSTALSRWPAELRLPIRNEVAHVVEGLTDLESKIAQEWVGQPDEVLMVTLNWAIAGAYHTVFKQQPFVRREDLDVSAVRAKFETDLKRIQDGKVPTWTDADRLVIKRYFDRASCA